MHSISNVLIVIIIPCVVIYFWNEIEPIADDVELNLQTKSMRVARTFIKPQSLIATWLLSFVSLFDLIANSNEHSIAEITSFSVLLAFYTLFSLLALILQKK